MEPGEDEKGEKDVGGEGGELGKGEGEGKGGGGGGEGGSFSEALCLSSSWTPAQVLVSI